MHALDVSSESWHADDTLLRNRFQSLKDVHVALSGKRINFTNGRLSSLPCGSGRRGGTRLLQCEELVASQTGGHSTYSAELVIRKVKNDVGASWPNP